VSPDTVDVEGAPEWARNSEEGDPMASKLRPRQPVVPASWFADQAGHVRRHRDLVARAIADAREKEAKARARHDAELARVRDHFRGRPRDELSAAERRGAIESARVRFAAELEPVLREASEAIATAALEARDLLTAARDAARVAIDPFVALRRSRRGAGGVDLSNVDAMSYRAFAIEVASAAGFEELRGLAQQAVDDGDFVLAHAVVIAIDRRRKEDRPIAPAELLAAMLLPEVEAARTAADDVAAAGREIATAWEEWATASRAVPPPGTGVRRIAAAIAARDPIAAFDTVVEDFHRLAALEPRSLRDLGAVEPRSATPDNEGGLAMLRAGIAAAGRNES
jgi:hypothetical protein